MKKAEIAEKIAEVTGGDVPDPDKHSAAELEAMLAEAEAPKEPGDLVEELRKPGGVTRRKVNRGSTRRINRALENMLKAIDAFVEEIDRQVYVTDEDGNRTGPIDLVKEAPEIKQKLRDEVASFTTPY